VANKPVKTPPVFGANPFPKVRVPALQTFINSTRNFGRDDSFMQALSKFSYRKRKVAANGMFGRVRAVNDAVIALGGNISDARAWTSQAFRWQKEGKAVENKYAKYEVDPACMAAMNNLLQFSASLPPDLMQGVATSLFGAPSFPRPGLPGASSSGSAGSSAPSSSPFGAPLSGRPSSSPPQPLPARPGGFFGRSTAPDATPNYIAAAFDALATVPDSQSPIELLQRLANQMAEARSHIPDAPETVLPDDLAALYELYHAGENDEERGKILKKIGLINDIRTIDHFYSVFKGTDAEPRLLNIFAHIGNDVGAAGLFSLLPISSDRRTDWLTGLCEIMEDARDRGLPLSENTRAMIWQVAESETAPGVAFSTTAYDLVALIGTPQAASLLWERATAVERDDLRVIIYALMRLDPGNRLQNLLTLYANFLATPHSLFTPRPEPTKIGIPFEALEPAVKKGKPGIAHAALTLIGHLDDPRVVPFLISQLSRKLPQLREVALRHLKRLKATEAADAVARLMDRDEALRLQAANILCEWEDGRCVPALIEASRKEDNPDLEKLMKLIGRFRHPAFDAWLIEGIDELKEGDITEQEEAIVEAIGILINIKSDSVQILFEKLMGFNAQAIKQALARHLPKLDAEWARKMHRTLIGDRSANVMYAAALASKDAELGAQLLTSRDDVRRVLGIRILWNAKDTARLLAVIRDEKPSPTRNMCIVAIGYLHDAAAESTLREIVEREDRLDSWGQNPAILAWRSLAKMGSLAKKET